MRIKIIKHTKPSANYLNSNLPSIISKGISSFGDMAVVDKSPDIVHIFASLSTASTTLVKDFEQKGIPVVFTFIDGLAELLPHLPPSTLNSQPPTLNPQLSTPNSQLSTPTPQPSTLNSQLSPPTPQLSTLNSQLSTLHCCGPSEARLAALLMPGVPLAVVPNPRFTATVDTASMLNQFHLIYTKVYASHEAKVKADIEHKVLKTTDTDNTIRRICSMLLYLKYSYQRETIRQSLLNELSAFLQSSDYDETSMQQSLNELQITPFASSAMSLLQTTSQLTEGFMPLPAVADKTALRMQKFII